MEGKHCPYGTISTILRMVAKGRAKCKIPPPPSTCHSEPTLFHRKKISYREKKKEQHQDDRTGELDLAFFIFLVNCSFHSVSLSQSESF